MEKTEVMMGRCYFCKGVVVKKKVDHLHRWRQHFYLVRGVPAEVCTQCGETYLGPEALRRMDRIIANPTPVKKAIRVPIFSLS